MQARQAGAGGGGGDGRDRGAGGRVGGPHQTVPATGLSRAAAHGQSDHHLAAGGRAGGGRGPGGRAGRALLRRGLRVAVGGLERAAGPDDWQQ